MTIADLGVDSWCLLPARQQPDWPDPAELRAVQTELSGYAPLVFASECDQLRDQLAAVARGEAFLLHGGDCAETFDGVSAAQIHNKLQTMLQMALVLSYAGSVPVVKVGRMAGQFAKPRSQPTETRDGVTLPAYRGDAVNGRAFTPESRRPDPTRLIRMYEASAAVLDEIRRFVTSGHADLRQAQAGNERFVALSPSVERYERLIQEVDRALRFSLACGMVPAQLCDTEFYVSHEALLLEYESALCADDPFSGERYDLSAHMMWIGERTRALDGAHIEFASRISNPIGVKLGPSATEDDVLALIDRLDPERVPGRLTLITRMGAARVRDVLPGLVESVRVAGAQVVWSCDPMHGNTTALPGGRKTRHFDDVLAEVTGFFEVHRELGTHVGGIHIELTGDEVAECVGRGTTAHDVVHRRYETACDPRLNRGQSLELAFLIAELYR